MPTCTKVNINHYQFALFRLFFVIFIVWHTCISKTVINTLFTFFKFLFMNRFNQFIGEFFVVILDLRIVFFHCIHLFYFRFSDWFLFNFRFLNWFLKGFYLVGGWRTTFVASECSRWSSTVSIGSWRSSSVIWCLLTKDLCNCFLSRTNSCRLLLLWSFFSLITILYQSYQILILCTLSWRWSRHRLAQLRSKFTCWTDATLLLFRQLLLLSFESVFW